MATNVEPNPRRAKLAESVLTECAKLAPANFDSMLRSYQEARDCLNSSDPRVRLASLNMIEYHWECTREVAEVCETLAFEDPDLTVREMAVLSLGTCYSGTYNFRIGRLLASMVHDATQASKLRCAAYQSLFSVRGLLLRNFLAFRFPDDVDWAFVDSFFVERQPPSEIERMRTQFPFWDEGTCRALIGWEKASQAFQSGDFDAVIRHLTECIKDIPGAGTYLRRGLAYLELRRWDEAIADFTKSLEISPHSVRAHLGRSRAYDAKRLLDPAKKDYDEAMKIDPSLTKELENKSGAMWIEEQ